MKRQLPRRQIIILESEIYVQHGPAGREVLEQERTKAHGENMGTHGIQIIYCQSNQCPVLGRHDLDSSNEICS